MRARHIMVGIMLIGVLASAASSAQAADADWLRSIYGRPAVTRGDVVIAAALFADEAHWTPDAKASLDVVRSHHALERDEVGDLGARASRGFACRVFARLLAIHGGLLMRLTHQNGRYAYRELVLHGLIPDGPSHLALTGDELAGLLNGASKFQETGAVRPPGM